MTNKDDSVDKDSMDNKDDTLEMLSYMRAKNDLEPMTPDDLISHTTYVYYSWMQRLRVCWRILTY